MAVGRLYFEELQKGAESPFNMSFMARKEVDCNHREKLPYLVENLMQRQLLSDAAARHCAQDILRYLLSCALRFPVKFFDNGYGDNR